VSSGSFERAQREYDNRTPPEPVWEGQIEVKCESEVNRQMVTPEMERLLNKLSSAYIDESVVTQLVNSWRYGESADLICTFEGEVDAYQMTRDGVLYWTCPVCGEERET